MSGNKQTGYRKNSPKHVGWEVLSAFIEVSRSSEFLTIHRRFLTPLRNRFNGRVVYPHLGNPPIDAYIKKKISHSINAKVMALYKYV